MRKLMPDIRMESDLLIVEAESAEAALREVTEQLGTKAQILGVERTLRGGIGGFFARELVQVRARPASANDAGTDVSEQAAGVDLPASESLATAGTGLPPWLQAGIAQAENPPDIDAERDEVDGTGTDTDAAMRNAPVSPVELALASLHSGGRDTRSFGDALRQELASAGWRPDQGSPAKVTAESTDGEPGASLVDAVTEAEAVAEVVAVGGAEVDEAAVAVPSDAVIGASHGPPAAPAPASSGGSQIVLDPQNSAPRSSTGDAAPATSMASPGAHPAATAADAHGAAARCAPVIAWSIEQLHRIGLPEDLIAEVGAQHPLDDLDWTTALGRALATMCRPLPAGDVLLAGPLAHHLAATAELVVQAPPVELPATGSVCAPVADSHTGRSWVAAQRRHRWLHLVAGGTQWRGLLVGQPAAVSWVGSDALVEAIGVCAEFGAVLGYGMTDSLSATPWRATPIDVAMAIRDLIPRT